MPLPLPPPAIGAGGSASYGPASQQPSYGGTDTMLSQPTGGQMSDPSTLIATAFRKILDLTDAINQSFPGGEDNIRQGLQLIGTGLQEKVQRMGMTEPPGPPTAA